MSTNWVNWINNHNRVSFSHKNVCSTDTCHYATEPLKNVMVGWNKPDKKVISVAATYWYTRCRSHMHIYYSWMVNAKSIETENHIISRWECKCISVNRICWDDENVLNGFMVTIIQFSKFTKIMELYTWHG